MFSGVLNLDPSAYHIIYNLGLLFNCRRFTCIAELPTALSRLRGLMSRGAGNRLLFLESSLYNRFLQHPPSGEHRGYPLNLHKTVPLYKSWEAGRMLPNCGLKNCPLLPQFGLITQLWPRNSVSYPLGRVLGLTYGCPKSASENQTLLQGLLHPRDTPDHQTHDILQICYPYCQSWS